MKWKAKGDWAHTRFSCTFVIFVVNSAAHSLSSWCLVAGVALRSPPACGLPLLRSFSYSLPSTQGLRFAHHLPMVCHSFGVWVTLSHQSRGYASLTTCLWSCQPFGLAFFSRASYKEYDSPCSSDWPRTDCTLPLPRAHDTVKFWFIIGLNSVIDFGRFNLTPIDTQSIPDPYPNMTARWDRGWVEARGKIRAISAWTGGGYSPCKDKKSVSPSRRGRRHALWKVLSANYNKYRVQIMISTEGWEQYYSMVKPTVM